MDVFVEAADPGRGLPAQSVVDDLLGNQLERAELLARGLDLVPGDVDPDETSLVDRGARPRSARASLRSWPESRTPRSGRRSSVRLRADASDGPALWLGRTDGAG